MALAPEVPSGPIECWKCRRTIDAADVYCRFCGSGQGGRVPWYYRHFGIIVSTLLGLGPFTIFLVWWSPVLTRRAKTIYTILITGFSAYIGYRTYVFFSHVFGLMQEYRRMLGV